MIPAPSLYLPKLLSGIRARLLVLVLLAVLPSLGLIIYSGIERREHDAKTAWHNAQHLAQSASRRHTELRDDTQQLFLLQSKLPAIRESEPCNALLISIIPQLQRYKSLSVTDMDGDPYCSSQNLPPGVNVADRPYFQEAVSQGKLSQSQFQISRADGKPVFVFAYPLVDQGGSTFGVLIAALDLAWLSDSLASSELEEGVSVTLYDKDGIVLARNVGADKWVGKQFEDSAVFRELQGGTGRTFDAIGLDGVQRLYAYTRVGEGENAPYLTVGLPRSVVFANANAGLLDSLILLVIVALLALLAAWFFGDLFLVRRIKSLVLASSSLARGDLGVRSGIRRRDGELGELEVAFDEMAASLQARQAAATAAEEERRESNARFRGIVEAASDAIISVDQNQRIVLFNRGAEVIFGYRANEVLGGSMALLLPQPLAPAHTSQSLAAVQTRRAAWASDATYPGDARMEPNSQSRPPSPRSCKGIR